MKKMPSTDFPIPGVPLMTTVLEVIFDGFPVMLYASRTKNNRGEFLPTFQGVPSGATRYCPSLLKVEDLHWWSVLNDSGVIFFAGETKAAGFEATVDLEWIDLL